MEKPILFNTSMVQAILEGRKTSTRRIIKDKYKNTSIEWFENKYGKRLVYMQNDVPEPIVHKDGSRSVHLKAYEEIKKPYQIGDILYVRETWSTQYDGIHDNNGYGIYVYKADGTILDNSEMISSSKWHPSIHMPKVAARIFLKVTNVKAQRLQDITEDEALKEGIKSYTKDEKVYKYAVNDDWWIEYCNKHKKAGTWWQEMPTTAREAFKYLWNSCGYKWPKCWDTNPWVWVIEFKKLDNYKI